MKKALKDTQTKALLKYINKERRRAYWDMQTPNLYIFFSKIEIFTIYSCMQPLFRVCYIRSILGIMQFAGECP